MSNLTAQNLIKTLYSVLTYSLLFIITSYSQITAQTNEMEFMIVNGTIVVNPDTTLFKEPSTILINNYLVETIFSLVIKPDSGIVEIIPDSLFPIIIYINDKIYEPLIVRFKNNIVESKIELKDDESGNKYIYISTRLWYEIKFDKNDLLIAPAAVKIFNKIFGKSSKSETIIRIHLKD